MQLNNQPCRRDCPNRQVGCHATCEKYIEFDKNRKRELQERLDKTRNNEYYKYKLEAIRKEKRRKR